VSAFLGQENNKLYFFLHALIVLHRQKLPSTVEVQLKCTEINLAVENLKLMMSWLAFALLD